MLAVVEPQAFAAAKPGEADTTCQDVAAACELGDNKGSIAFAVADGATGGFDGQLWADLVVGEAMMALRELDDHVDESWVRHSLGDALARARSKWESINASLGDGDDPVAIMSHGKFLRSGGHCTITAGVIGPTNGGTWALRGVAVGDSPLFHVRIVDGHYELQHAFPLDQSDQFDSKPNLVSSKPSSLGIVVEGAKAFLFPDLRLNDVILVATDALAEWALIQAEQGERVWDELVLLNHSSFDALLDDIQTNREIAPDDVLLLRLAIVAEPLPLPDEVRQ